MLRNILPLGVMAAIALACGSETERVVAPQPDSAVLADAQQQIAEREYHASRNELGLQAPNRAHALRTYFTTTGIAVHERAAGTKLLGLELASVGRGGNLRPVPAGEVSSEGSRVEISRAGLVEWFENSPEGLEQGFTLAQRPEGEGELVLELELRGATAQLRGDDVVLTAATGRKLGYSHLVAQDAVGRTLASRFEIADAGGVRLAVADDGASYPVEIDPIVNSVPDTRLAATAPNTSFGSSAANAGDVNGDGYEDLIVGGGAAYIYLGGPGGIDDGGPSTAATVLTSVGSSVSGAGDVNGDGYDDVIVGNRFHGGNSQGAAFIFLGSAAGIPSGSAATAATTLEASLAQEQFGTEVAAAGDVNGDGYGDVIVTSANVIALFHGSASGIASGNLAGAATRLTVARAVASAAGDVNGDGFGDVIVGAQHYANGEINEGAVFVFHGSATGIADGGPSTAAAWFESQQAYAYLGGSVASAGDVNDDGYGDVIVNASGYSVDPGGWGAAFVFQGSATGIGSGGLAAAAARLESDRGHRIIGALAAGDMNGDGYDDVAVSGVKVPQEHYVWVSVFVGGAGGIADAHPTSGIFVDLPAEFVSYYEAALGSHGDLNGDGFDDLLVGAPGADGVTGKAYVYHGSAEVGVRPVLPQSQASLGSSVAAAGDVNGDGFDDVIVGASRFDAGQVDEGAAFVFLGGSAGISDHDPSGAAGMIESNRAGAYFGGSVGGAGDVNGDGFGDVIVGDPNYGVGDPYYDGRGRALVYLGGAEGIGIETHATADTVLEANPPAVWFGISVAGAGDVNGDGFGDVIVGAPYYSSGQTREGAAFVFHGSATGVADGSATTAAAVLESNQSSALLGASVASAGDVNGDGYGDVIVGAPHHQPPSKGGAAFVFTGGPSGVASGTPATAATRLASDQQDSALGWSVAGAGDVNEDGYGDVIIGAPEYNRYTSPNASGSAFVFHGSPTGIADATPATAASRLGSDRPHMGASVAGAGDIDADGASDVVVGTGQYYTYASIGYSPSTAGAAFAFRGSSSGIASGGPELAALWMELGQINDQFGASVAGAGDVNADGRSDVIAGAPYFGSQWEGKFVVFPEPPVALSLLCGAAWAAALARRRRRAVRNLG